MQKNNQKHRREQTDELLSEHEGRMFVGPGVAGALP